MDYTKAVDDWVSSEHRCDLTLSGNIIWREKRVVAIKYQTNDGLVVIVNSDETDLIAVLGRVKCQLIAVPRGSSSSLFDYFETEEKIEMDSSDEVNDSRLGSKIVSASTKLFDLGLEYPKRLAAAGRAEHLSRECMALLAFHDLLIPPKFRYAMPTNEISLSRIKMQGGIFRTGDGVFTIFEMEEDAIACKLQSNSAVIIDLQGKEPVDLPKEFKLEEEDVPF